MTKKPLSSIAELIWEAFNEDEPGVFVDYADCLANALCALAYNVDWESGDPKFLILGIADEFKG